MTELKVYGPYTIKCSNKGAARTIDNSEKAAFLKEIPQSVGSKQGCYVFAMKAGRGHKAWYVGKTKRSFYSECMGSHQQDHYQEVFARGIKGTPVMFFIAPNDAKKVVPRKVLGQIERFLIQAALLKNPDLRNNHHAAEPEWCIKGVIRGSAGKPTSEASKFATMMGVVK